MVGWGLRVSVVESSLWHHPIDLPEGYHAAAREQSLARYGAVASRASHCRRDGAQAPRVEGRRCSRPQQWISFRRFVVRASAVLVLDLRRPRAAERHHGSRHSICTDRHTPALRPVPTVLDAARSDGESAFTPKRSGRRPD